MINEKLKMIKSIYHVNCILQVGSFSDNDLDLFVFSDDIKEYTREVIKENDCHYDISYISIPILKQGIKEKWPFLVNSLKSYQVLYHKDNQVLDLLKVINCLKPEKLNQEDINYYRFFINEELEALNRRLMQPESCFLCYSLFKETLIIFYKLNQLFIPKAKKIIAGISKIDDKLAEMCYDFILENIIERKMAILNQIIDYVFKPFGGRLTEWKKGKFPLK